MAWARSRSASLTPATRAPERTWVSLRMWSWPIIPTPMTPTLTVTTRVLPERSAVVGPAPDRAESAGHEVAGGTGGDGQRDVRFDRVEVLLDHGEQVGVEFGERCQQWRHVGLAVRRLDHGTELHGLRQR